MSRQYDAQNAPTPEDDTMITEARLKNSMLNEALDTAEVVALRAHLEANSGIKGLEVVGPGDIARAVDLFRRDGFVVIADVLNEDQTQFLASGCSDVANEILALDTARNGNRGSHRYSFGGSSLTRSQLHRLEWQMMLETPFVDEIVTAIFGSQDYSLRAASGDFCLPGAVGYQPIIQVLPEGAQMGAIGVISADRRYVRISTAPTFSTIGDVQTFTFAGSAEQTDDDDQ